MPPLPPLRRFAAYHQRCRAVCRYIFAFAALLILFCCRHAADADAALPLFIDFRRDSILPPLMPCHALFSYYAIAFMPTMPLICAVRCLAQHHKRHEILCDKTHYSRARDDAQAPHATKPASTITMAPKRLTRGARARAMQ
jgi:hypothetical protein